MFDIEISSEFGNKHLALKFILRRTVQERRKSSKLGNMSATDKLLVKTEGVSGRRYENRVASAHFAEPAPFAPLVGDDWERE